MRSSLGRIVGVIALTVVAGLASLPTPPSAAAAARCPSVSVTTLRAAATPIADWSENLTFDADGNLWVSRGQRDVVERYSRAGRRTASVAVAQPGAVRLGPDGLLYVASGDGGLNVVPFLPRTGTIVRLNPKAPQPHPRIFASGFGMPNGMAFGPDDHLYVADSRLGLLRVSPRGTIDARWSARAPKSQLPSATVNGFSLNGVAASGENLYVTMTSSATGRVLRVPIDDPARTTVAADLTAPFPGLLDDLIAPHGGVLVVTTVTGQVITADLRTGTSCAVDAGQPVTAVAADPRRPGRVVAGTESGDLLSLKFAGH